MCSSETMLLSLLILVCCSLLTEGRHFDGGTITWAPLDPYDNSSSVNITITQSYAWTYPLITCATNVPISTSGRTNWNLTCVVDCSTDGGYSTKPIDILTDCTSVSSSLGMMNSQRSHNLTLAADAHFYLANVGSAWVALNDPAVSGLEWSIVTLIDLRIRPDGFINTPPVASVVSPQYAFVNQTIEINIPVSDVNQGDDVRCRWSTYTAGNRRRKRFDNVEHIQRLSTVRFYKKVADDKKIIHIRKKRNCGNPCNLVCAYTCDCSCSACTGTTCGNGTCGTFFGCVTTTAAGVTYPATTTTTTASSTTTSESTTIDTPGTLKSTSSYAHQQAIDECGGICYPGSLPNGTTLANCTITFTGLTAGTWYALALQVEDFINDTSTTPMSSVPVQFLIYVLPQPKCPEPPIILPVTSCLEVQVGVSMSISIYAMNLCAPSIATLTDIIVSSGINGMSAGSLTNSSTNSSLSYVTFTWTPQANQVGSQQLCVIAYTSEKVQSNQSCIIFTVKNTSDICVTTTTTSTSTTSVSTTTTSQTTTTTSTTTTSTTTTTTTSTTSTSTTTSTTTSSTSTSSTSTSTTSTSTSTTTSSTSTSSTSTSTTSTSTSTTTTSVTTTTSTRTTATTQTTTTVTTATTTTVTTTKAPEKPVNWPLILGLSLLALLLAVCCSCCCLYWFLWGPAARRRRQRKEEEDNVGQKTFLPRHIAHLTRKTRAISRVYHPRASNNNHPADNISHGKDSMTHNSSSGLRISLPESTMVAKGVEEEKIVSSIRSVKRIRHASIPKMNNTEKVDEIENVDIKSANNRDSHGNSSVIRGPSVAALYMNKLPNTDETNKRDSSVTQQKTRSAASIIPPKSAQVINVIRVPRNKTSKSSRPRASSVGNISIIHLDKSCIEIRPAGDRSATAMPGTSGKANIDSGVIVTKIPRKLITSQSRRS